MSNFEFIIHINSISGRSINDISKYYIFPWTVINFQSDMNPNFYNVLANFRDLTKPVGSIDVQ